MPLPKIELPTYELTIPSNGDVIKVRPFTVKEEKLLLIAAESKDANEIISTVKQVINNCIIEGAVDINKSPFFDIDYIFIFLRAKSVSETVPMRMTCNNVLEDGTTCGNMFPKTLALLGLFNILTLYSLMMAASPLGRPGPFPTALFLTAASSFLLGLAIGIFLKVEGLVFQLFRSNRPKNNKFWGCCFFKHRQTHILS